MRWCFLYKFYLYQFTKSRIYLSASIGVLIVLTLRIYLYLNTWFEQENLGQLPSEIFVIIQMFSIIYMVFFYMFFSKELKYGVHTLFVDGYKILLEKIGSSFLAHLSLQIIILFIINAIFFIVYVFVGVEISTFYLSLIRFFINYQLIPLIISYIFGVIVALVLGSRKISFIVILLIWVFTGIINKELFSAFFYKITSNEWKALLSIGSNSIYTVYQSYLGFNLDVGTEFKAMTWITFLIVLVLSLTLKWARINREKEITLLIILVLIPTSIIFGYKGINSSSKIFNDADNRLESNLYQSLSKPQVDLNYDIKSYKIYLNNYQAKTEIEFSKTNTVTPTFQLYYAYPIHSVLVDDKEVSYSRSGDILKVNSFTKSFKTISISYELRDTNIIPVRKKRMALLANHAWYPKKRESHLFIYNEYLDGIEKIDDLSEEVKYSYYLETDNVLYTNLKKSSKGYFGFTSDISLIKGQGNKMTYKDYNITYPADWPKMNSRIKDVITTWESAFDEISLLAPLKYNTLPKEIVFSNFGLTNLLTDNHIIYETRSSTAINDFETMQEFEKNLLYLSVDRKGERYIFNEWINMVSQFVRSEQNLENRLHGPTIETLRDSELVNQIVNTLYSNFNLLSREEKRDFLRTWYNEMDDSWTWMDVENLMGEWE